MTAAKQLRGQKVVVIGGRTGMGLATAQAALREGAEVVVASRSAGRLQVEFDGAVEAVTLDVADERQVAAFFERVDSLDHLVVTSVARASGSVVDTNLERARGVFETKFWGSVHAVRHAVPRMNPTGSITLFSGVGAWRPFPGGSINAAVNGAVESLVRALTVDLGPIRVNAISPGLILTPTWDDVDEERRDVYFAKFAEALPVARVGRSEDVASAVIYLMTNGYTTGSVLEVEGGYRLIPPINEPYPWVGAASHGVESAPTP